MSRLVSMQEAVAKTAPSCLPCGEGQIIIEALFFPVGILYIESVRVKKSIYLETTIPSYATAKPSTDIIAVARQLLTNLFWEKERHKYNLLISQFVIDECSGGDKEAARKRLQFISGIEQLEIPQGVEKLAEAYQKILGIPDKARYDCLHLAYCVLGKVDYLLSWNCTHLGNVTQNKIRNYNDSHSLYTPSLVTPEFFTT